MFARLLIDLGFRAVVRLDEAFPPIEVDEGGYRFAIHRPYKSSITPADRDFAEGSVVFEVTERLVPADPQPMSVLLDGEPAVVADALCVDIFGPVTREPGDGTPTEDNPTPDEPAVGVAFAVANRVLQRLRVVAQAWIVRPLDLSQCLWHLRYLADDGSELAPNPPLVRTRATARLVIPSMTLIRPDGLWAEIRDLPQNYIVPPWETLLLDAIGLLPEAGPAIVLAASAIETRIDDALQRLADQRGESVAALWSWLSQRGQYWRRPSFEEGLSEMLGILGGRPLREDDALWEAFQNLRKARNSYAHEGVARIGDRPVTSQEANELLGKARLIIDFVEEQLREELRRPRYAREHKLTIQAFLDQSAPGV